MKQIDDLFRDGLGGLKSEVPKDMWSRIQSAKPTVPAGEQVDEVFAAGLRDRVGEVPAGMWERIVAARARRPMKLFVAGLSVLVFLLTIAGYFFMDGERFAEPAGEPAPAETATPAQTAPLAGQDASTAAAPLAAAAATPTPAGERTDPNAAGRITPSATSGTSLRQLSGESVTGEPVAVSGDGGNSGNDQTGALPSAPGGVTPAATAIVPAPEVEVPVSRLPKNELAPRALAPLTPFALAPLPTGANPPEPRRHYRPRASEGSAFRASQRHRFRGELLFGVAYANQMFRERDESQRLLREVRQVSEFPEVSYQITLRGTYKLGERMLLLGGLTYAEIRNSVEYSQFLNGSIADVVTNNQIRLLEAPLLLGYRIPGRRLRVSVNAGPLLNLSTSARGRFLSPDATEPLDLAIDGNYRGNIGVGFMTSLSTTYRIGKEEPFLLLVEPFFKTYPGAFTVNGAPLREKYWVAGLQLGVRKGF